MSLEFHGVKQPRSATVQEHGFSQKMKEIDYMQDVICSITVVL